jgi:PAS domain S-box-containing protein
MKGIELTAQRIYAQRWWISLPFVLALAVFLFIVSTILKVFVYPYDGITNIGTGGVIARIDQASPTAEKLLEGDIVVLIGGVPWDDTVSTYNEYLGKKTGDRVDLVIRRNDETVPVTIALTTPPLSEVIIRLVPILVALLFLGVGIGVKAYSPADGAADLFFIWTQVCAVTLTAGVASYLGPAWATVLFSCSLRLIGPLSVHFHTKFPQYSTIRSKSALLYFLYALALLGIALYLIWGPAGLKIAGWYSFYVTSGRLILALSLLIVVGLLYLAYRYPLSPGTRSKVRLVVLGGVLAILPFAALTVLPDALFKQTIIHYSFAFIFLGIIPLTYGYAIFRYKLIEIDTHVNRGATYILVYSVLGIFYLVLNALIQRLTPLALIETTLVNTIVVMVLATIFLPLHKYIQKIVDRIFYGGWYDYRLAVTNIAQGLEQTTDLNTLAQEVARRIVDTFRLQETSVFLRDLSGEFSVIEVASQDNLHGQQARSYPILPRSSLNYLLRIGATERSTLRKELAQVNVTPEELQLLNSEQINLWVPIIGHGQIMGLLAIGPKLGGDIFSGEDMDILRSVVRNISTIIDNIYLLTRLREYTAELEQRVSERTAELYNAKERVEAILASVGDGVIVSDLTGRIITVNAAYVTQSGYEEHEIIGRNLLDLLGEDNGAVVLAEIETCLKAGEVWKGELNNHHKNGRQYDTQLTIAPVRNQDGYVIGYVGSQIDITIQKELERIKDHFIADVSHELRTPTTNINLYLELLEFAPSEKRRQYMDVVREQSQLLVNIVEDTLDLSRLGRAKESREEFEPVDLNQLAEQVVTAHKPLADNSGIALLFEPDPLIPHILGEHNQLARLIANLVRNAIHYTMSGSVFVRTCVKDGHVCLQVADTGMGIEAEDLPHIFDRFYRGRNVRQSKIHGTGLGLAIVKEIVNFHNGKIEVESEVGKGSTFTVWLSALRG